jgi:hypothetical protein
MVKPVLKNEPLRQQVEASITGMVYIIKRTEEAAAPGVEPCPCGADKPEPTCTNRHQCWEPCGELGKSEEHARAVREPNIAFDGAQEVLGHKVGCPALGGYGACLCGAAGVKGPDHG